MSHLNGACAGFGSCHLRLRPATVNRATFVFGDSVFERIDVGVIDAFEPVMAALLEDIYATGSAIGRSGADVHGFVEGVFRGDAAQARRLFEPRIARASATTSRPRCTAPWP